MKRIDVQRSKHIKTLVYGYPGSGKTHFCGTFALDDRSSPVLHVDCAGNPSTLRNLDAMPDVISIDKFSDLNYIYDWLVKGQPTNHPLVTQMNLTPGYKTLVFDGISDLQRYSFDAVMGEEGKDIADKPRAPEFGDWRGVLKQMTAIAHRFFSLPMHVVVTAWEYVKTDEYGQTRYRPFLQGQSIDTVPGYALCVARLIHKSRVNGAMEKALKDIPDTVNVMLLQPTKNYDAKDQNGFGISYLTNPTATKLLDLLEK